MDIKSKSTENNIEKVRKQKGINNSQNEKALIRKIPGQWHFSHQNILRLETILGIIQRTSLRDMRFSCTKSQFLTNFFDFKKAGKGAFGTVLKVKKHPYLIGDEFDVLKFEKNSYSFEDTFAIKLIPNYKSDAALAEIKSLANLIHPNVVSCYNVWEEDNTTVSTEGWSLIQKPFQEQAKNPPKSYESSDLGSSHSLPKVDGLSKCLFLQYEYCSEGTLEGLLKSRDKSKWANGDLVYLEENKNILQQILEGLVYLQYQGVVHGDLKVDNVFIVKKKGGLIAKIGDFGLSLNVNEVDYPSQTAGYPRLSEVEEWDYKFPRIYMPPEYRENIRSHKGDMYSFGLVLFLMLIPFESDARKRDAVFDAMYPRKYRKYPPRLFKMYPVEAIWIEKLLSHSRDTRPSAVELREEIGKSNYGCDKITCGKNLDLNEYLNLISIGMDLFSKANYKHGYRYSSLGFYKYLDVQNNLSEPENSRFLNKIQVTSDSDIIEYFVTHSFTTISSKLNKPLDCYYRLSHFLKTLMKNCSEEETILKVKYAIVTTLGTISEDDKAYRELVQSGLPEIDVYIKETLKSIESSETYQTLLWKDPWKLEVETAICKYLYLEEDGIELEKVLLRLVWVEQGIQENNHDLYRRLPNREPQEYKLLDSRMLRANIEFKLGRVQTSTEMYQWLLESVFLSYKSGLHTFQAVHYLLSEYAKNNLCALRKFETAIIYLQASYLVRVMVHGIEYFNSASAVSNDMLLVVLYKLLGFNSDLEAFVKFEFIRGRRNQDFAMLASKEDDGLFRALLTSDKFLKDFMKKVEKEVPGIVTLNECPLDTGVKNSFGRKYTSAEELIADPPVEFLKEGWWRDDVLEWAKQFLVGVKFRESKDSEN